MTRKEAIKIVQSATVWTDEEREALAMLIPELAESEDERTREWLLDYFKSVGESWIHRDITPEQIIAYLEKQKEQPSFPDNLDEAAHSYSESDEPLYSPGHRYHWDNDSLFGKQIETAFKAGAEWMAKQMNNDN